MSESDPCRLLLVTSDPASIARVSEVCRGEGQSASATDRSYLIEALPEESAIPPCGRGYQIDPQSRFHGVLVDWPKEGSSHLIDRLAAALATDITLTVVLLAEAPEAVLKSVRHRLPADRTTIAAWSLDRFALRQAIDAAVENHRLRRALGSMEGDARHLQAMADDIQRRGKELERWQNELLANVSHEIRTPLNAILGFSRFLLEESQTESHMRRLQHIHDAGDSLLEIINSILDFSNLADGRVRLKKGPFSLRDVLAGLVEEYRAAATEKGLLLDCHILPRFPDRLRGDRQRYRQVLASLLSNAVKFTERGSIHIRVSVDETAADQLMVRTIVTDSGIGIPADRHDAVFREFSQGDGSATRSYGGLGLGLAVAKRLVDLMGGQIGFRSAPGEGSSFWVTLPLEMLPPRNAAATDDAPPIPVVARHAPQDDSAHRRQRILAVADDPANRLLIEAFLSRSGCLVDTFASAADAVPAAESIDYDLILLDAARAEARGEAMEQFRAIQERRDEPTPILAIVPPDDSARDRAMWAGAAGVLSRPLNAAELVRVVRSQISLPDDPFLPREPEGREEDDRHSGGTEQEGGKSWFDQIDDLRRALEVGDFSCLESRTKDLRRCAVEQGSQAAADDFMRLQLAARSRDRQRISLAMERLDRGSSDPAAEETGCREMCRIF